MKVALMQGKRHAMTIMEGNVCIKYKDALHLNPPTPVHVSLENCIVRKLLWPTVGSFLTTQPKVPSVAVATTVVTMVASPEGGGG